MDTIDKMDRFTIDSLEGLARIYDRPVEGVLRKEADHITDVGRAFIAAGVLGGSHRKHCRGAGFQSRGRGVLHDIPGPDHCRDA